MKKTIVEKIFSYVLAGGLGALVLVLGFSLIYWQPRSTPVVYTDPEWPVPFELEPSLLTARSAIVYDPLEDEVLYAKDADRVLPLASLTKLLAAQAVLARQGAQTEVTITPEAVMPEGDWGFWIGDRWSVGSLVRFSLAASSNDAIAAAAAALGPESIAAINNEAKQLGLNHTQVFNPTGLDESESEAGGYGSAHDVAVLAAYFLEEHPTFFESTAAPSVTIAEHGRMLTATSTAVPLLDMPGLIGAKTGYTDLAGGNLVAAFDLELGRPVIIAVLGSTREGRFADVKLLLEQVRKK